MKKIHIVSTEMKDVEELMSRDYPSDIPEGKINDCLLTLIMLGSILISRVPDQYNTTRIFQVTGYTPYLYICLEHQTMASNGMIAYGYDEKLHQ